MYIPDFESPSKICRPQYLVHVVFNEIPAANRYINKRQVPDQQVWIYGHIRSGRTDAQKTKMVERLMSECSEATGIERSYIWAYINDVAKAAEFGQVLPAPGENEKEWEEAIPKDVRERYGFPERR